MTSIATTRLQPQHLPRAEPAQRRAIQGFTLIELIVVIVILGVLAAIALPRFTNLSNSASVAAVNSLAASVRETASNWRMLCVVQTASACNSTAGVFSISNNGQSIQIWNGWPDAGDSIATNEIDTAVQASNFTITLAAGQRTLWHLTSARDPNTCYVQYTEALSAGTEPTVTVETSGC